MGEIKANTVYQNIRIANSVIQKENKNILFKINIVIKKSNKRSLIMVQ